MLLLLILSNIADVIQVESDRRDYDSEYEFYLEESLGRYGF